MSNIYLYYILFKFYKELCYLYGTEQALLYFEDFLEKMYDSCLNSK